ncbi:MAG: DUF167 family protein [Candidatus Paceibacterota bacterium]|jgi:hypothetical protein
MTYIRVKVIAGAKKDSIMKKTKDSFDVSVREPKERGLANKKVVELVRRHTKAKGIVRIVSGHHSTSKIISLEDK